MDKRILDRRLFLAGSGAAIIGLPLVEELVPERAHAQAGGVPRRVLTMSFGLGIDKVLQDEGAMGPLEPLWKYFSTNRAAFFSNLTNEHLRGEDLIGHFDVGASQFTGKKQNGPNAGGPSLEQLVKNSLHPTGVPSVTGLPSMSAGMWSRTGEVSQYTRHWNKDGSPGEKPERRPSKVFDAIFGGYTAPGGEPGAPAPTDPAAVFEAHVQRSVFDTVMAHYDHLKGPRSFLGAASKARIDNHLTEIRQVERQLVAGDQVGNMMTAFECGAPSKADYADPAGISFYDAPEGGTGGPEANWEDLQKAFRLSGKLFALGYTCDALRFGSMIYAGAGEHLRHRGVYEATAIKRPPLDFSGTGGASIHDAYFHNYVEDNVRVYQHFCISHLAYVVDQLDATMEPNGKTVLDNTLVVIGTEYGRNHDGTKEIFHAVLGGEGKFKPGMYPGNHGFNDVYATLMKGYGIPDHGIDGEDIPGLLA